MLNKALKVTIVIVFMIIGLILGEYVKPLLLDVLGRELGNYGLFGTTVTRVVAFSLGGFVFGILGFIAAPFLISQTVFFTEILAKILAKIPTTEIVVVVFGAILGLVLANLLGTPFSRLPIFGPYIPIILSIIFGLVGGRLASYKHKEILAASKFLPIFNGSKSKEDNKTEEETAVKAEVVENIPPTSAELAQELCTNLKYVDTSVLIDGRIVDIVRTGFIEGALIIPQFVIEELQKIADSSDTLKRNKGRRGLDIVRKLQNERDATVIISDKDYDDITEVDAKLVRIAKEDPGYVLTNDYNLNKVADINGVKVLNINELANAVKTVLIPGEEMHVALVKEGKETGQALAYLEDGTMIVVEGAKKHVGDGVDIVVTSVLQTSAGRMIFAKLK